MNTHKVISIRDPDLGSKARVRYLHVTGARLGHVGIDSSPSEPSKCVISMYELLFILWDPHAPYRIITDYKIVIRKKDKG